MAPTSIRLRAEVTGRVQGVGFRQFAQREAIALGVSGYVRNRPDGSVEVVTEGQREILEVFVDRLRLGPRSARVSAVDVNWTLATGEFRYFDVRF